MSPLRHSLFIFLLVILPVFSAHAANNEAVAGHIAKFFENGSTGSGLEAIDANHEAVKAYYASRNFKPVWTRDNGPKGKGKALLLELQRSTVHGLSPSFYNVEEASGLISSTDHGELARLDLLLSGAWIEYAHDLMNGRLGSNSSTRHNQVTAVTRDANELVSGAADAGNLPRFASDLLTTDDRYFRLIAKLSEFDRIEKSGSWPKLAGDGEEILRDQKDARMEQIRMILALFGDLPFEKMDAGAVHDSDTFKAVNIFQRRHGMEPTGILDKTTLKEMATPLATSIKRIQVNLERRRWQNRSPGPTHLYVNLADSSARLVVDEKSVTFFPLVSNESLENLPTFFGKITALTTSEGPEVSAKLEFEVENPDAEISSEKTTLEIALDNPANRSALFSSVKFGEELSDADIASLPPSHRYELSEPLNLYVTYLTAWSNKDGTLHFRPDIYNRDETVAGLLKLD